MEKQRSSVRRLLLAIALFAGLTRCAYHWEHQDAKAPEDEALTFARLRAEVLAPRCFSCHSGATAAGGLALNDREAMIAAGLVVPGKPETSLLYVVVANDAMPPGPAKLSPGEKARIHRWIALGALEHAPPDGEPLAPPSLGFDEVKAKVLAVSCVRCHRGDRPAGGVRLERYDDFFEPDAPLVLAGAPEESRLYAVVRDDVMPPRFPLSDEGKRLIRRWIADGARP
jgi:mono/diheme cytochrome c family protein